MMCIGCVASALLLKSAHELNRLGRASLGRASLGRASLGRAGLGRAGQGWRSISVVVGLATLLLWSPRLIANDTFFAPRDREENSSGLQLSVEMLGLRHIAPATGIIQLQTSDGGQLTRQRVFEVEVIFNETITPEVNVTATVTIEEGESQGQQAISLPAFGYIEVVRIIVREDRRELTDLEIFSPVDAGGIDPGPAWLLVAENANEMRAQATAYFQGRRDQAVSSGVGWTEWLSIYSGDSLRPDQLFDRWTLYSAFNAIIISEQDLSELIAERPKAYEAILQWLSTGRTLFVNCDADTKSIRERLDRDLASKSEQGFLGLRWYAPKDFGQVLATGASAGASALFREREPVDEVDSDRTRIGVFGNATIVCTDLERTNEFAQDRVQSVASLRGIGDDQERIGYIPGGGERRYGDWLIPGVGLPPVGTFRVLITLFVIVIGPVNYFLLRRLKRLYLLMVTVPCGALLVCLGLIVYSFFSDGIGVKARVLSVTKIDQRTQRVTSWSRQSYYAGIMPGDGVRFPASSEVLPIVADGQSRRVYEYFEEGDWVRLRRGNTGTRTTSQFLVTNVAKSEARIDVSEQQPNPNEFSFSNRLGAEILVIGFVDEAGELYVCENVADEASASAMQVDREQFVLSVTELIRESTPFFPVGYSPPANNQFAPGPNRSNQQQVRKSGYEGAGVLGDSILRILACDQLEPNSYWAVTGRPATIPIAFDSVQEVDSLHIIVGKW